MYSQSLDSFPVPLAEPQGRGILLSPPQRFHLALNPSGGLVTEPAVHVPGFTPVAL